METYNLAKELKLTKLHVFPYSVRRGTKASTFPQVDEKIKKDRATRLIALSTKLENEYASLYIGKKLPMIIEQKSGHYMVGHTSNFLQIYLPYDENLIKKEVIVEVKNLDNNKIFGQIIEKIEN